MTRLLPLATVLLVLTSLRLIADDAAPAQPTPNGDPRAQHETTDTNAVTQSDETKSDSLAPSDGGANNGHPAAASADAPVPKPETPAARTARLKKVFRYEINGDTRRILDTTFAYPKNIAQLEADFDKCLDEERYQDGEKVVAELFRLLREQHTKSEMSLWGNTLPYTQHVLLKAWDLEAALCHRAVAGEFGTGPNRRRSVALGRWKQVREMAEALKSSELQNYPLPAVAGDSYPAVAPTNDPSSLAYLLLRALKAEERQAVNQDELILATLNAATESIEVRLLTSSVGLSAYSGLDSSLVRWKRSRLNAIPDDALLDRDQVILSNDQMYLLEPLPKDAPFRRSQLGTADAANLAFQKKKDAATQERVQSTLQQLFPSETIEVHAVQDTAILRASLKNVVHEAQIVSIARSLCANVLNQMTVNGDTTNRVAPVADKLEPIGVDPHGLREILARLYPKEHIEVHVLPMNNAAVLRGHLSRVEYAQQVYDIANTSYAKVLYQMTPELPTKPTPPQAGSTKSTAREAAGTMTGIASREVTPAPAVAPTAPTDVQEAAMDREARQLATKFRTAKLDEQPALRRQMEQLTERHFEQRQQRRQSEIDVLGQRLDKLRVTHRRRQENKATVIRQRLQDLLDPNADLRWDEPKVNEVSNTDASRRVGTAHQADAGPRLFSSKDQMMGDAHPTAARPVAASLAEPTFDGTPYSQWLKMLETERKPEKLAAAMEACQRLAAKGDERRIVRAIIAGARLFDATDPEIERNTIWSSGQAALRKMLNRDIGEETEAIAEELLAYVDAPRFVESPKFVCGFLTALMISHPKTVESLRSRMPAFIAALVRHDAASKEFNSELAVAATAIWLVSNKPINDFEGLRPLVLKGYEKAVEENIAGPKTVQQKQGLESWTESLGEPWQSLQTRQRVDEVPEVVTILGRHMDKNPDYLVKVLGTLGPAASPTVPKLIERLVTVWKTHDDVDRTAAAGKDSSFRDSTWASQMQIVLDALQKIGPRAKPAAPILKEFLSISPVKTGGDGVLNERHWMFAKVNGTLLAIGETADSTDSETPQVLSDFCHLTTIWKLTSSQPSQPIQGIRMRVGRVVEFSGPRASQDEIIRLVGFGTNPRSYVIDESTTPKQITLVDKDRKDDQQFGIYELKGDRLKIEFAKPGLPRPKEFSADRDQLPEGHVLLEFERDRGEGTP